MTGTKGQEDRGPESPHRTLGTAGSWGLGPVLRTRGNSPDLAKQGLCSWDAGTDPGMGTVSKITWVARNVIPGACRERQSDICIQKRTSHGKTKPRDVATSPGRLGAPEAGGGRKGLPGSAREPSPALWVHAPASSSERTHLRCHRRTGNLLPRPQEAPLFCSSIFGFPP